MTVISREIEINASKADVWKAISKFGDICHASPGVLKSRVTSEQQEGVGATRHCDFSMMGASVEERILEWNEGESLKIDVYQFEKLPGIQTMKAHFKVKETNSVKTVLTATLEYSMKNPFFNIMNVLMMKGMNTKNWDAVLAGHKKYIETGEIVTEKTVLELDKVIAVN
jgi:carbon monoxide dehydrogenase subunit G